MEEIESDPEPDPNALSRADQEEVKRFKEKEQCFF
jgi:hypothetical protein